MEPGDRVHEGVRREDHCYAETFAERWRGIPGHHFEHGFDVTLRPERLEQPLRWRGPKRIFVNSMSDLFHDRVPDEFIARVFAVMTLAPQHTFMVLTKRPGRMRSLLCSGPRWRTLLHDTADWVAGLALPVPVDRFVTLLGGAKAPPPNVWLGVSAESPGWAPVRLGALAAVPGAAVRFASCEPLLAPLDLRPWLGSGLDWVIVGGESGPGARLMDLAWARDIIAQCGAAGVPVFVKQLGTAAGRELGAGPKGGDWDAWPADLKVRGFPRTAAAPS